MSPIADTDRIAESGAAPASGSEAWSGVRTFRFGVTAARVVPAARHRGTRNPSTTMVDTSRACASTAAGSQGEAGSNFVASDTRL